MEKTKQIYKYNGKTFRYDFNRSVVEYVAKADAQMVADDNEWKATHNGRSLWDIDADGYIVLDAVGLSREHWKHKDERNEYLDEYAYELDYEAELLARDFERYGKI